PSLAVVWTLSNSRPHHPWRGVRPGASMLARKSRSHPGHRMNLAGIAGSETGLFRLGRLFETTVLGFGSHENFCNRPYQNVKPFPGLEHPRGMRKTTPRRWGKAAIGVLAGVAAALSQPALAEDANPEVQAGRVDPGVITVDGRLDEAAWQQAGVIQDLTQQSPKPGQPTPYHTKVLLLRDDHTLYIGLVCDDPDPSRAISHTLVRDGWQGNDDNVLFMLDTFGTKRFAYVFRVNSAGAMADGLQSPTPAINSNDGVDYNWDGIWSATVVQGEHGWTAEIHRH